MPTEEAALAPCGQGVEGTCRRTFLFDEPESGDGRMRKHVGA